MTSTCRGAVPLEGPACSAAIGAESSVTVTCLVAVSVLPAVSATETATVWNGYMDGAIQSGERAAAEVLEKE